MTSSRQAVIRLGTRPSRLAKIQANLVADAVRSAGDRDVVLVEISTPGDASTAPISEFSTVGVFVSSLRAALLRGEIDVAVHSYKDLPTAPHPGLTIAAVPLREDPRDVLVARDGKNLLELPPGSRVGTGSPRRTAQLNALQLGLDVVGIRGNVDTRLAAVASGAVDAVVVARAGLARLGRLDEVTETLDPIQILPAPAQGALAVECRAEDADLLGVLGELDDYGSRATVEAERSLLAGWQRLSTQAFAVQKYLFIDVAVERQEFPLRGSLRQRRDLQFGQPDVSTHVQRDRARSDTGNRFFLQHPVIEIEAHAPVGKLNL